MSVFSTVKAKAKSFFSGKTTNGEAQDMTELVGKINRVFDQCKTYKDRHVRQWRLNDAFVKGYHYVAFRPVTNELYTVPVPKGRVRLVENHIQEIYLTLLSILTSGKPSVFVAPFTAEPQDISDARAQQFLLDYLWEDLELQKVLQEAVAYGILANRMFLKVFWDANAGDEIFVPRSTQEISQLVSNLVEQNGVNAVSGNALPNDVYYRKESTGYIGIYAVNPHNIYVEPHVKSFKDCRRLIETHVYNIDDAKEIWPEQMKDMTPNLFSSQINTSTVRLEDQYKYTYDSKSLDEYRDLVLVLEYFELPTKQYPEGRWVVTCDNKVLDYRESCLTLPFVSEQLILDNFSFWGDINKISTAIPVNMELNKTVSQIIEAKNKVISPRMYLLAGSGIDVDQITDAPNSIIEGLLDKNQAPFPEQVQPIPQEVYMFPDQLRTIIENVSGIHGVTKGEAESNLGSGRAIAFMAEKDQQKFAHPARNIERLYCNASIEMMKLWKAYMPVDKTITVMGNSMAWESISFQNNQIKSFNVFVRPYSLMMSNKALQNDFIIQLATARLIDPVESLKLLEFGNSHLLWGDQQTDTANAKIENVQMMNGIVPQPHWWENHTAHYQVHSDWMKTIEYEQAPEKIRIAFEEHLKATVMAIQSNMQQAQGMIAPGAEGGQQVKPTPDQGYDIGKRGGKQTVDSGEEQALAGRAGLA